MPRRRKNRHSTSKWSDTIWRKRPSFTPRMVVTGAAWPNPKDLSSTRLKCMAPSSEFDHVWPRAPRPNLKSPVSARVLGQRKKLFGARDQNGVLDAIYGGDADAAEVRNRGGRVLLPGGLSLR